MDKANNVIVYVLRLRDKVLRDVVMEDIIVSMLEKLYSLYMKNFFLAHIQFVK